MRQGWSTWGRRSDPWDRSPETATHPGCGDQSGDVEGCSASDRGTSLALRLPRPCVEARRVFAQPSLTASSGEPLVPPPPAALPIMHGAVVLSGGLVGIGAAGCPPRADSSARETVACAETAQTGACGRLEVALAGTVVAAGTGIGAGAAAARTTGAAGETATSSWAGSGDRIAAPCGVGADSGLATVETTWARGRDTPTARTTGFRTSTGATGSRGTEA